MKVSGVDIFLFIRILFVCDMGSSTDDLFALMMLYRYMDMGRCNLLGVMIDRIGAANADAVDALNNFYGYPDIPIGLERSGIERPVVFISYHNFPYAVRHGAEDVGSARRHQRG